MHARATILTVPGDRQDEGVESYQTALATFREIAGIVGRFSSSIEAAGKRSA